YTTLFRSQRILDFSIIWLFKRTTGFLAVFLWSFRNFFSVNGLLSHQILHPSDHFVAEGLSTVDHRLSATTVLNKNAEPENLAFRFGRKITVSEYSFRHLP